MSLPCEHRPDDHNNERGGCPRDEDAAFHKVFFPKTYDRPRCCNWPTIPLRREQEKSFKAISESSPESPAAVSWNTSFATRCLIIEAIYAYPDLQFLSGACTRICGNFDDDRLQIAAAFQARVGVDSRRSPGSAGIS